MPPVTKESPSLRDRIVDLVHQSQIEKAQKAKKEEEKQEKKQWQESKAEEQKSEKQSKKTRRPVGWARYVGISGVCSHFFPVPAVDLLEPLKTHQRGVATLARLALEA